MNTELVSMAVAVSIKLLFMVFFLLLLFKPKPYIVLRVIKLIPLGNVFTLLRDA